MNWISENKFLSGFIGFMIVGMGALGYLLIEAMGNFSAQQAAYNTKMGQLDQLQKRIPYPNDKNYETYKKQGDELKAVIDSLNQDLAKVQFPLDPAVTPQQFQKNLQAAITAASDKAGTGKIPLPDKFAFGFDTYVSTPAVPAAAPALDRQLKAVQFVVDELLDSKVASISSISRGELSEEKTGKP